MSVDFSLIPFKRPFSASLAASKTPAPAPDVETTAVTLSVTFDIETPSRAWTTRFDTAATATVASGLLGVAELVSQLPRTGLATVLGRITDAAGGNNPGPLVVTYVAANGRSIDVSGQQRLDVVVAAELVGAVGKSVRLTPGQPLVLAVTVRLMAEGGADSSPPPPTAARSDSAMGLPPQVPSSSSSMPPSQADYADLPPQMATLTRRPADGSAAMSLPPQLADNVGPGFADGTAPPFPAPASSSTGGGLYVASPAADITAPPKSAKPTAAQLIRAPTPEEASKAFDFAALDQWLVWHVDHGVQLQYTHEIVDWACADGNRFAVAQWWWDAYTKHGIEFLYSAWAVDNACAGGHIGPLRWLWSIHQHHGMPFKYTEYSLTAASGGGHVEILSWWAKAHTAHGLELKYTGAAIDDASAAGFTPVLEWWLSAASRYRLELRYSADAVNAAARARRWDVLAWWRRAAESNPSIITLKYDAAALTAQARSALGLPEPQPRPPTAPTPAALTPQHTGASYSAPPPRYSTAVGAPSVPSTPTAQQTTIYMVVAGDGQQQQQAPAAQPAEDAGINWRALLPWIIGLVILLIVFVSIFGAIGAVILGALVLYCCVKILC